MITFFFANNYKSLVNFKIEFDRISALIGNNGSGKSTVFFALSSLQQFILGRGRTTDFFNAYSLTRWMKSFVQTFEFGMKANDNDQEYVYHLELEYDHVTGKCAVKHESVSCAGKKIFSSIKGEVTFLIASGESMQSSMLRIDNSFSGISYIANGIQNTEVSVFMMMVTNLVICSINPLKMLDQVIAETWVPDRDFSNIGSIISYLSQVRPNVITDLWAQLQQIEPSFERLRIEIGAPGKNLVAEYRYNDVFVGYAFAELSEGEKVLVALYLILFGYLREGYTVFIDEPDNYVALREIQPWCRAVVDACIEQGQCIVISHHPEIIDYYGMTNGIWFSRLKSGESEIRKKPMGSEFTDFMKCSELIAGGFLDENE